MVELNKQRYEHNCLSCEFLGPWLEYDLYAHNLGESYPVLLVAVNDSSHDNVLTGYVGKMHEEPALKVAAGRYDFKYGEQLRRAASEQW